MTKAKMEKVTALTQEECIQRLVVIAAAHEIGEDGNGNPEQVPRCDVGDEPNGERCEIFRSVMLAGLMHGRGYGVADLDLIAEWLSTYDTSEEYVKREDWRERSNRALDTPTRRA